MEKYTVLELLGEGSYGKVLKCKHNESGSLVAIKKFIETEEDSGARKVALREIRMLKKLHHPNLVCLLEVFRRKKRFHLVFEYMTCNLLEELEAQGSFPEDVVRKYMYQILRGVDYCHSHNIIHRDIKPENILISDLGIVKLCDFGFARFATVSNEPFTDYVATRWYRPPELLVGETNYGRAVDIWALGCIQIEMLTGEPLFPGNSDIDQLYHITKLLGSLTESQKLLLNKYNHLDLNGEDLLEHFRNRLKMDSAYCLRETFSDLNRRTTDFAASCLRLDPDTRLTSEQLLSHNYFTWDLFLNHYIPEIQKKVHLELSRRVSVTDIPCATVELSYNYSPVPYTRRPSRASTGWTINLISEGVATENSFYKDILEGRKSYEKACTLEKEKTLEASKANQKSAAEIMGDWRERKSSEMPKISLDYKRNMMPSSQTYVKPVKGRLVYDKNLTFPCDNDLLGKPPCEGIYLPLIKTIPDNKPTSEKKDGSYLKRKKSSQKDVEKSKPQTETDDELNLNSGGKSKFRPNIQSYHNPCKYK